MQVRLNGMHTQSGGTVLKISFISLWIDMIITKQNKKDDCWNNRKQYTILYKTRIW